MPRYSGAATSDKKKRHQSQKHRVGKRKRVPENATPVSFKTRSIVVPSQLEGTQEPTTKRKLSLPTLLAQLHHYKISTRRDALIGLRDLLQDHPELKLPNLGRVLESSMTTLMDSDASIRHALTILLKFLFTNTEVEHIQPFFATLVAHMSCGLTHINDQVQLYSLKVFDLILEHYPRLLVPLAHDLLPLLTGLISRQKAVLAVSKKEAKVEFGTTALASNPSSKLSYQASRLQIFSQLCRFMQALLEHLEGCSGAMSVGSPATFQAPIVDVTGRRVLVNRNGILEPTLTAFADFSHPIPHVAVIKTHGMQIPPDAFQSIPATTSHNLPTHFLQNQVQFLEFVQSLISLLLECWIECSPSDLLNPVAAKSVKAETLNLMGVILNLLCLTLKLVFQVDQVNSGHTHMETLSERNFTDFQKHFMAYFPFFDFKSRKRHKFTLNFAVCQIMLLLLSATPTDHDRHSVRANITISSISSFLATLEKNATIVASDAHIILPCVKSIVETLPLLLPALAAYQVPPESQEEVFKGIWSLYQACHIQSAAKRMLIQCFITLLEKTLQEKQKDSCPLLSQLLLLWLQTLPNLFVQLGSSAPETSALIINCIACAAMNGRGAELEGLQKDFSNILGPESIVSRLPPMTQRQVFELVWHLPVLGTAELSLLAQCISSGMFEAGLMGYLIQIIHHRLTHDRCVTPVALYLSFMLALTLGYTQEELEALNAQLGSEERSSLRLTESREQVSAEYRMKILQVVCECLGSTRFSSQLLELLQPAIHALLDGVVTLPLDAAVGILKLTCYFVSESEQVPAQLEPLLGQLCFSSLVAIETGLPQPPDTPFVAKCLELTNQILSLSQPATLAVLHEFQTSFKAGIWNVSYRPVVKAFIGLLNNPAVNATLRQCRGSISQTSLTLMGPVPPDDADLMPQVELAVAKYRILS